MAPPFLRRAGTANCFFCLSPAPAPAAPPTARAFHCPHCGCWNRYDANGDIVSDEPAMHDESLNARSFARRASPHKDRLPSSYGRGHFCHTCQTNQMLLLNLISNYLPHPQHPHYAQRLEQLPAYRESLHARYPPVCASCLPAVQDEIEQKDQMARTMALGGWLKETKGKERLRLATTATTDRERLGHLAIWRARGAMWWFTLLSILVAYVAALRGSEFPNLILRAAPVLPAFSLFSLSYTTWDPTYYRFSKARAQGRNVRIKGKNFHFILQTLSWLSRFTSSILLALASHSPSWDYLHTATYPLSSRLSMYCLISLVVELLILSSSFTILHPQPPPTIRLIDTSRRSSVRGTPEASAQSARASPMPAGEPDLFASLTLSSKPFISSTNPMFGHPSLTYSVPSPIKVDENADEDAMDWTPTNPSPVKLSNVVDDNEDGALLRPQRFFPPEHPTGLENLFANTKLDDGDARLTKATAPIWRNARAIGWPSVAIAIVLIPLSSIVYHLWKKGWIQ